MAKRRRLAKSPSDINQSRLTTRQPRPSASGTSGSLGTGGSSGTSGSSGTGGFNPVRLAIGMLGASFVYVSYYPSDSVSVERGDALYFALMVIGIATIVWSAWFWSSRFWSTDEKAEQHATTNGEVTSRSRYTRVFDASLDIIPWILAAWMMFAAFASCPPGNLRMATNEAWLWISAAAVFTASRRLFICLPTRQAMLLLMVVGSVGLAVHGLHQHLVSLPANRMEYQQDPERILALAGVDAPPGSAERMVFENRLFDGGPTGTFALANSLAAALLLGVIVTLGVLRMQWRSLSPSQRVLWGIALLLCVSCLLAARSRTAVLAMLAGSALIFVVGSQDRRRNARTLWIGLGGVTLVGLAGAVFLALRGNREWFEQAPASLAFRFQYWRSTWKLALDHPWIGAGPGNFQSMYERYREPSATEQIAEPHNLFFETLASGGFVALGLLTLIILSGGLLMVIRGAARMSRLSVEANHESVEAADRPATTNARQGIDENMHGDGDTVRWLWLGAILALVLVWLIGWASRQLPDPQANLFVIPVCVATALLLWRSVQSLSTRDLDVLLAITLIGLGIHLMFSGGWTVPGVAMSLWVIAAMLTRRPDPCKAGRPIVSALVLATGLLLAATLYVQSLQPVENQKRLMSLAASSQSTGRSALATLEGAAAADPWSPDGMLWLADYYRWKLIVEPGSRPSRRRWETCLDEVKRRAGDDPAVYRMIGAQQLHVYQRHGDPKDLAAAGQTFARAVEWSPANQWLIAQLAVVSSAEDNHSEAERLANRAWALSRMGGNIERALSRQQVYPARFVGETALRGPIREPAASLLPEPKPPQ